ncbi:hypothetical protein BASA61_009728 [Batrachochytrium salamandrivorans]|nr:hypothetical protein BASA61_009728 [Batrachochytrium salamandrivorans]
MFDFANIMSAYETSTPTPPVVIPSTPSTPPAPKLPLPNIPGVYNWPALVFAPTVDTTGTKCRQFGHHVQHCWYFHV